MKGLVAASLAYPGKSGIPNTHVRFLSRMKIQELKWEKGQMNGPSPKPQLDPQTSWN
jgi:hypothetical protein